MLPRKGRRPTAEGPSQLGPVPVVADQVAQNHAYSAAAASRYESLYNSGEHASYQARFATPVTRSKCQNLGRLRFRLRTWLLVVAVFCGLCHVIADGVVESLSSFDSYHQRMGWTFEESTASGIRTFEPSLQPAYRVYWSRLISNASLTAAIVLGTLCAFAWDRLSVSRDLNSRAHRAPPDSDPNGTPMTRPLKSKLLYVSAFAVLGGALLALVAYSPYDKRLVLIVAGVLLLLPGRVQGFVFRDHYRGRRLMATGQLESAVAHFERFLARLRAAPWKKRFIWLAWGFYSWDIEAMTLNNLGVALMGLGEWDAARDRNEEALRVDPKYPVPYFNLAVLAAAQGDEAHARELLARAEALGYARTPLDRVIHMGQSLLAHVEGRGSSLDSAASHGA